MQPSTGEPKSGIDPKAIAINAIVALVTVVITAYVTHCFTMKRTRTEEELRAMESVANRVSTLMDKRLWSTRKLLEFSERGGSKREYQQLLKDYRASVTAWNVELNDNLRKIEGSFGKEAREELEFGIGTGFKDLNEAMTRERRTPLPELTRQLDALNETVANFNKKLGEKIQERKSRT